MEIRTADEATDALVDRLLDMDDEDFHDVAREDRRLRKLNDVELSPLLEALRHDDVLDRWLDTVNQTDADIVLSISMAKERMDDARRGGDEEEFHHQRRTRAKAVRALEGVKEQRREVKELIADRNRREAEQEGLERRRRKQERIRRHEAHKASAHEQAYQRALRRLRDAHPEEFARYLAELTAAPAAEPAPPAPRNRT